MNSLPRHALLLIGPSWVGDMVMAHSLIQVLRERKPDLAVDVLAPGWSVELVERMPGVRKAVVMDLGHGRLGLAQRRGLGRDLRDRYDQAIVLPNSWKSALVPFFARIPRRTGYVGECRFGLLNDRRRLDKAKLPMTVQRFVALGLPGNASLPPACPPPRLRVDPDGARHVADVFELSLDRPVLVLCPGAEYGHAKRWPARHFAEVGKAMREQGWQVWIMGSEKDLEAAAQVHALIGAQCVNLAGRTTLAQAVDLMILASAVVSNDSGLMHVAAALDRPLVVVYGSSDPGFTPPLSQAARVVTLGLTCSPCFQRQCRFHHYNCLETLLPALVLQTLQKVVNFAHGRPRT